MLCKVRNLQLIDESGLTVYSRGECVVHKDIHVPSVDCIDRVPPSLNVTIVKIQQCMVQDGVTV